MHGTSGGQWRRGCHATGTCPQSRVVHQVVEALGASCITEHGVASATVAELRVDSAMSSFCFLLLLYRNAGKTSAVHEFSFVFFLMHKSAMEMLLFADPWRSYLTHLMYIFSLLYAMILRKKFGALKADFLFTPIFKLGNKTLSDENYDLELAIILQG